MTETKLSEIKAEFKDRLFFYPTDALYILDIAMALQLSPEDEYKLFSVMGAAELRNTLPLYKTEDFTSTHTIDLQIKLPKSPDKIKSLLDNLKQRADNVATGLPAVFALLSDSKEAFAEVFKILISAPLTYQSMRFIPACKLATMDENKNIYEITLYGFNPFDDKWIDYIRRNKRTIKKLSEHNNRLFAGKFGFFSLSKLPAKTKEDNFITKSVIQGINALQTYSPEGMYFNAPETVKSLIDKFGLLETGGIEK